ncbi:unnamed protein product [Medioppia subpectinata]|uniref:Major facilitator superfamily (MFS) profile domain-containing protein n=1 Tax=Medioppia subpectinata TaxID=1979941 RepID=A0A7R9L6K2_9ACAR|nr:unnamed protein product [Medioppia subpectinata]CAG2115369.1 unnamed protein product [Medioppia subpectinata]
MVSAGTISSAQGVSLAATTFGAGILSDRVPARTLLVAAFAICSITTLLLSTAPVSAGLFSALWFTNGVGQGLALPPMIGLTRLHSKPAQFATNWALVLLSVNVASIVNPFAATWIAGAYGWRQYIAFAGVQTLMVGAVCYIFLDGNQPTSADNKSNNKSTKTTNIKPVGASVWQQILSSPLTMLTIAISFMEGVGRFGIMDWLPMYMDKQLGFDPYRTSMFISVASVGGIFGKVLAGKLSDTLVGRAQPSNTDPLWRPRARLLVSVVMFAVNAVGLHALCFGTYESSGTLWLVMTALLIGVAISGNVVNISVMGTELGPKELAGTYSAIVTLAGLVGGVFAGLPLSTVAEYYSWNAAFIVIEIIYCLADEENQTYNTDEVDITTVKTALTGNKHNPDETKTKHITPDTDKTFTNDQDHNKKSHLDAKNSPPDGTDEYQGYDGGVAKNKDNKVKVHDKSPTDEAVEPSDVDLAKDYKKVSIGGNKDFNSRNTGYGYDPDNKGNDEYGKDQETYGNPVKPGDEKQPGADKKPHGQKPGYEESYDDGFNVPDTGKEHKKQPGSLPDTPVAGAGDKYPEDKYTGVETKDKYPGSDGYSPVKPGEKYPEIDTKDKYPDNDGYGQPKPGDKHPSIDTKNKYPDNDGYGQPKPGDKHPSIDTKNKYPGNEGYGQVKPGDKYPGVGDSGKGQGEYPSGGADYDFGGAVGGNDKGVVVGGGDKGVNEVGGGYDKHEKHVVIGNHVVDTLIDLIKRDYRVDFEKVALSEVGPIKHGRWGE